MDLGPYKPTCAQNDTYNSWAEVECVDNMPNPEWRIKESHCMPKCEPANPAEVACKSVEDCHHSQMCVGGSCQPKTCNMPSLEKGLEVSGDEEISYPIATVINVKCKTGYRPTNKDSTTQDLVCRHNLSALHHSAFVTLDGSSWLNCTKGKPFQLFHGGFKISNMIFMNSMCK